MEEFLTFRKMITPMVIQVIFWLGVGFSVLAAFATMFQGSYFVLVGLFWLVAGPLMVRIYCELLMLLFRIYEELVSIRMTVAPGAAGSGPITYGFPVTPMTPGPATSTPSATTSPDPASGPV